MPTSSIEAAAGQAWSQAGSPWARPYTVRQNMQEAENMQVPNSMLQVVTKMRHTTRWQEFYIRLLCWVPMKILQVVEFAKDAVFVPTWSPLYEVHPKTGCRMRGLLCLEQ